MGIFSLQSIWDSIFKIFGYVRASKDTKDNTDYAELNKYNFTEIFSNALTAYSICDKSIAVQGTSDRALFLDKAIKDLCEDLSKISCFMLGFGGVLIVPYVDFVTKELSFKITMQKNLKIEKTVGKKIYDCTILVDIIKRNDTESEYKLFRRYQLLQKTLVMTHIAFYGNSQVELSTVPEWAEFQQQSVISGVEKMTFAYFKSPKDNRKTHYNKGVPITYGSESIIKEIEECLCQVRDEFGAKQVRLFVENTLFDSEEKLEKIYKKVNSGATNDGMFETFDPAFRDSAYYARLMQLFALLEKSIGTSAGILTPFETKDATATAIKRSSLATYNLVDEVRNSLNRGINDYVKACEVFINYYSLAPFGDYELSIDWTYSLTEDSQESFEQLMQAQSVGAVSKAEIRQFVKPSETLEQAQDAIAEIEKAEPTIANTFSV